jgi:hypothetical protein
VGLYPRRGVGSVRPAVVVLTHAGTGPVRGSHPPRRPFDFELGGAVNDGARLGSSAARRAPAAVGLWVQPALPRVASGQTRATVPW